MLKIGTRKLTILNAIIVKAELELLGAHCAIQPDHTVLVTHKGHITWVCSTSDARQAERDILTNLTRWPGWAHLP